MTYDITKVTPTPWSIEDFDKPEFLDGVRCRYVLHNEKDDCDIVAYVFEKENVEHIKKSINNIDIVDKLYRHLSGEDEVYDSDIDAIADFMENYNG